MAREPVAPSIQRDVVCAVHDGVELEGRLHLPPGPGPHPAVVLLHGGGWKGPSKVGSWQDWASYLADHGYATLAAFYRSADRGKPMFAGSLWDVRAAVQWLHGRGAEFGIDPSRIAALGDSAGGHLTAMLALTGREQLAGPYPDDPHAGETAHVDVAVPVYGIFDLIQQWEHDQLARPQDHMTEIYLGGTPMSCRPTYYEASPLYHASQRNADGTAWLFVYGTEDPVVDPRQSEVMAEHVQRAGGLVRILPVTGAGHFWLRETPIAADIPDNPSAYAAPRIVQFLDKHLG